MRHNAKRLLAGMILLAPFCMTAQADVHIDVGLGFLPGILPPPVVIAPPPVYASPPPPVYYGPGVVYGDPDWEYGGYGWHDRWEHDHWRREHWHGRGDWHR